MEASGARSHLPALTLDCNMQTIGPFYDFEPGHQVGSALGSNLLFDLGQNLWGRLDDTHLTDEKSKAWGT